MNLMNLNRLKKRKKNAKERRESAKNIYLKWKRYMPNINFII